MPYKYLSIVRITHGFYEGQLGAVTQKLGHRANGTPGESSEEVYEVMLMIGKHTIDVGDKDLKPEVLPELKEEEKETGELIENAVENEEDTENLEEHHHHSFD